jgi:hypothetical protein
MNDEDAREYRVRIAQMLRSNGYSWVVDEVQGAVAAGKLFEKEIDERFDPQTASDSHDVEETQSRGKGKARRTSTAPFSEHEQLNLLLTAIDRAVTNRVETEDAIFDALFDVAEIAFEPESVDIAAEPSGGGHMLTRHERTEANAIGHRARRALNSLRSLIDVS